MDFLVYVAMFLQAAAQPQVAQQADVAFRAGYAAMAKGDLARADAEFARVVRLTPKIAAGHSAYGAVLLAEGHGGAAIPELEMAHRLDAKDETATLNLGIAYAGQQRYADAVAMLHLLGSTAALTPEASLAYATALTATGDLPGAGTLLRQAMAAAPQSAALHDGLGAVMAQQEQYDAAQPELEDAVRLDAGMASAHLHLGSLYFVQRQYGPAVAELTKAAGLAPNNVATLLQLGRAQMAMRQDEAAVATLTHAHTIVPASSDASYLLALALQNSGQSKEALPLFASAAEDRPKDSAILANYALALVQTGNAKDAVPLYERALLLNATSPVLREDLGVAYLQQSDLDRAITEFRAGLAMPNDGAPITAELHYDLGLAMKLKDKLPEAIAEFEVAAKLDPALPDPPYTLGVLYMQTGRFDDAAREMERALAMQSGNGDGWSILGNIYKEMQQPGKAAEALRKAIELVPSQPSPHISLAAILAQQGDREGAAAERKKGAELSRIAVSRQRADFSLRSGLALLKDGKLAEAMVQLQSAVDADPNYAAAHRGLAEGLSRRGNVADAALERQKADGLERR